MEELDKESLKRDYRLARQSPVVSPHESTEASIADAPKHLWNSFAAGFTENTLVKKVWNIGEDIFADPKQFFFSKLTDIGSEVNDFLKPNQVRYTTKDIERYFGVKSEKALYLSQIKHKKAMMEAEAKNQQANKYFDKLVSQSSLNYPLWIANYAAYIAGSFADPAGIGAAYKTAKVGYRALSGWKASSKVGSILKGMTAGAIGNIAYEPIYYGASKAAGEDVDVSDLMRNMALSGLIGAFLGGITHRASDYDMILDTAVKQKLNGLAVNIDGLADFLSREGGGGGSLLSEIFDQPIFRTNISKKTSNFIESANGELTFGEIKNIPTDAASSRSFIVVYSNKIGVEPKDVRYFGKRIEGSKEIHVFYEADANFKPKEAKWKLLRDLVDTPVVAQIPERLAIRELSNAEIANRLPKDKFNSATIGGGSADLLRSVKPDFVRRIFFDTQQIDSGVFDSATKDLADPSLKRRGAGFLQGTIKNFFVNKFENKDALQPLIKKYADELVLASEGSLSSNDGRDIVSGILKEIEKNITRNYTKKGLKAELSDELQLKKFAEWDLGQDFDDIHRQVFKNIGDSFRQKFVDKYTSNLALNGWRDFLAKAEKKGNSSSEALYSYLGGFGLSTKPSHKVQDSVITRIQSIGHSLQNQLFMRLEDIGGAGFFFDKKHAQAIAKELELIEYGEKPSSESIFADIAKAIKEVETEAIKKLTDMGDNFDLLQGFIFHQTNDQIRILTSSIDEFMGCHLKNMDLERTFQVKPGDFEGLMSRFIAKLNPKKPRIKSKRDVDGLIDSLLQEKQHEMLSAATKHGSDDHELIAEIIDLGGKFDEKTVEELSKTTNLSADSIELLGDLEDLRMAHLDQSIAFKHIANALFDIRDHLSMQGYGKNADKSLIDATHLSRKLFYKDSDAMLRVNSLYGKKVFSDSVMSGLSSLGRRVALIERLGTNPLLTLREMATDAKIAEQDHTLSSLTDQIMGRVHSKNPRVHRYLTRPAKLMQNVFFLPMTVIKSLFTDLASQALMMKYTYGEPLYKFLPKEVRGVLSAYSETTLRYVGNKLTNSSKLKLLHLPKVSRSKASLDRETARYLGVSFEELSENVNQMTESDTIDDFVSRANACYFRWTSQSFWTDGTTQMAAKFNNAALADRVHRFASMEDLGKAYPILVKKLDQFGITSADFGALKRGLTVIGDDVKLLYPQDILDYDLQGKLLSFYYATINQSVNLPSPRTLSSMIVPKNQNKGSPMDVIQELTTRFLQFPLATLHNQLQHYRQGNSTGERYKIAAAIFGTLTTAGFLTSVLNDVAHNRQPRLDVSTAVESIGYGGFGGIASDVGSKLAHGFTRGKTPSLSNVSSEQTFLKPVDQFVIRPAKFLVKKATGKKANKSLLPFGKIGDRIPFSNPIIQIAEEYIFSDALLRLFSPKELNRKKKQMRKYGEEYIVKPNSRLFK